MVSRDILTISMPTKIVKAAPDLTALGFSMRI